MCHLPSSTSFCEESRWQTTYRREFTWKSPGRPPAWVGADERFGVRSQASQTDWETEDNKVSVGVQTEETGEKWEDWVGDEAGDVIGAGWGYEVCEGILVDLI